MARNRPVAVAPAEQRLGERDDAPVHREQAHLDAGERSRQGRPIYPGCPLAESLLAALLRALQAAGRSAEALDRYDRARKRLAEQRALDVFTDLEHPRVSEIRDRLATAS